MLEKIFDSRLKGFKRVSSGATCQGGDGYVLRMAMVNCPYSS
jgi:hypothetical protein